MICPDDEPSETTKLQAQLRETADVLLAVMRERDALREQVRRAETDLAALRAAVVKLHAARGDSYLDRLVSVEEAAFVDLLALLPPEQT